jgi:ATP-binding cassette subfamily B protein
LAAFSVLNGGIALKLLIEEGIQEYTFYNVPLFYMIVTIFVLSLASFGRSYFMSWIGEKFTTELRKDLFSHLIYLDVHFFENLKPGQIIAKLSTDLSFVQMFIGRSIGIFIRNIILFIGSIIFMIFNAPLLSLYSVVGIIITSLPIIFMVKKLKKSTMISEEHYAKFIVTIDDVFNAIKTVQSFVKESFFVSLFNKENNLVFTLQQRRLFLKSCLAMIVIILLSLFVGTIIFEGIKFVKAETLTHGELISFIYFTILVASTLSYFSEFITDLQKTTYILFDLQKLSEQTSVIKEQSICKNLPFPLRGIVAIHNVSFAYPSNPEHKVLNSITLSLIPGEKLAIVGPSGGGKSTLLSLLLRFFDPQIGKIYLDGIDLKELSLHQLRETVAIVPQEVDIFSMSLMDNILYGITSQTTEYEIQNAIQALQIDEIAQKLPHGFQTVVGHKGVRLSGGQKQRIGIARALLKKPTLLLLDEATSHLDAISEDIIQRALNQITKTCTSIIVAHRLSTVLSCDRIAVLKNGKLDDIGTHAELISKDGLYRQLASLQFQNI